MHGSISIVVPCYNEATRLDRAAFEELLLDPTGPVLILVDDGSTDGTVEILQSIASANPSRCHVVKSPRNQGKAEAVRMGLIRASDTGAACVGYWDADLATPVRHIREFAALLDVRPEADIVMGSRVRMLGRTIERSGLRHLIGRAYATMASIVLGVPVYDTQCGAKLLRSSPALRQALALPFTSRWSFDVELLQRLQQAWGHRGLDRMIEVPLIEWRDVGGSKVSLRAGGAAFLHLFLMLFRGSRSLPERPAGASRTWREAAGDVAAGELHDAEPTMDAAAPGPRRA
jgi:dolichyl-phosphate beta-glucosyltransferase